jgi:hypothetical protein
MEFKPGEIAAIVLALAIPLGLFVILLTPGAVDGIIAFVMQPGRMPYIFYGGAIIAFGFLGWRLFRRIRPKPRKPQDPLDG